MQNLGQKFLGLFALLFSAAALAVEPVPSLNLFAIPGPALRTNSAPAAASPLPKTEPVEIALSVEDRAELLIQRHEAMNGSRVLSPPPPQDEAGGAYGFVKRTIFDPVTTPEVLKLGKVQMTGGLVGAFKKKNPFYLLNPLVFALDW